MAVWNEYEVTYRDGSTETVVAQRARWARNDPDTPMLLLLPRSHFSEQEGEGRRTDGRLVTVTARDVPAP